MKQCYPNYTARKTKDIFKVILFTFLFVFVIVGNLHATTYTWKGITTNFTVNTNWNPTGVPVANDILIFPSGTWTVSNIPTQSVGALTVQAGAIVTLQPAATNTLSLTSASSIALTGSLTISNNLTLGNTGTIAVNGLLDFNSSNANSPSGITVNSGGELKYDGSGAAIINAPAISGGTLTLGGSVSGSTGTSPGYTNGTLQYTSGSNVNSGVEVAATVSKVVIATPSTSTVVTLRKSVTVSALTLTSGILYILDPNQLSYNGTAANLSAGSSSSYINLTSAPTSYDFQLGDGVTSMSAGTYTIPIGTTTTTGNPSVNGYRPLKIVWSAASASNYFMVGYINDNGTSSSPGNPIDIPLTGNNRTGLIAGFISGTTSYGLSMSYINSDFTTAPAISTVSIFNWDGSEWSPNCQSSNLSGTPDFVDVSSFNQASGSVALGVIGGTDLTGPSPSTATYYWTGKVSTAWENYLNWSGGPCGFYPGQIHINDTVYITSATTNQPTLSSSVRVWNVSISNGEVLTLSSTASLAVYATGTNGIITSSGGTISANVASTIEYADATPTGSPFGWLNSSSAQIVNTTFTYGNLYLSTGSVSKDGLKYINASCNIAGNLITANTTYVYINAGTTTVAKNVTGSIFGNNSFLDMTGTGMLLTSYSSSMGPRLIVDGTTTVVNSVSISGGLVVSLGRTLTINNGSTVTIPDSLYSPTGFGENGKVQFYNYGTIQSASSNGGTIAFDHTQLSNNQLTLNLPSGNGTGGAFNSTSGNQVSLKVLGSEYTFYGSAAVTVILDNSLTSLTVYNLSLAPGTAGYIFNDYVVLSIASGKTVIANGGFENWYVDGITGPGTIQFNNTVNIPSGTATGGTFNHTIGSLVNLVVGDGTTSNTVTATGTDTVNNLTANVGASMAVSSGIISYVYGNVFCSGTIKDATSSGNLALISPVTSTLDGGSSGTHGQIIISKLYISWAGAARIFNSTAYLDFSASTFCFDNQPTTVTNNGNIKFNGTSFGSVLGGCAQGFLTASNQIFINNSTATCTVIGAVNIGNCGSNSYISNSGTINCASINIYAFNIFYNNNGGFVHCTGSGGIVATGFGKAFQYWYNYPGSWVDVAGPFFEDGGTSPWGTLVCSSAVNTVKYDGTGTQIIYPTQYNNLTIAKSAGSNNGTLTNGNDSINGILTFTSGNMNAAGSGNTVVVTSTGSVSGASQATGWVNGNLQMPIPAGASTTTITIGDYAIYAPINLMMSGANGASVTSYTLPTNSPNDPTPYPSGIDQTHHVLRYWRMTPNSLTFTGYNATFNFANPTDIVGDATNDPPQYVVHKYDPIWTTTTVGSRTSTNTQETGLTTYGGPYGDFEIGIDSSANLPIHLLTFTAAAEASEVLLKWITVSEINNNYFTVEKTADGQNYATVGNVDGAGNSTMMLNYSLVDAHPYNGISYYRLKQTDYDGKYSYSPLQPVNFNKSTTGLLTIFPNPVSDLLYISAPVGSENINYTLHLYNVTGSEVASPSNLIFEKGNLITVDMSSYAPGVYTLSITSEGGVQQEKVIKKW